MSFKPFILFVFLVFLINGVMLAQSKMIHNDPSQGEQENLSVFNKWLRWNNPGAMLIDELVANARQQYDAREKEIAQIVTADQWKKRQEYVRNTLKTFFNNSYVAGPLNAKITGVIKKQGYRIEKIVFESAPGYFVTGSLYVPQKIKGKAPVVLNLMGHDQEAFRAELYQIINANLALKGIMAFSIDPPGQGEMVQYYDTASRESSVGYSVMEHCYFGNQCFLMGMSPAVHFVRDGRRAIDYLLTRKDVDAGNIGLTGFSGGGTITTYLGAVDERIKVSVPCSWSTASRFQSQTKGAQDAESIIPEALAAGISTEDLIELRAPKPTMLTFVTRDQYLSIQGGREIYKEAKKTYTAFGQAGMLQYVEDDSKHWLTPKIRKAIYSFFLQHFNMPSNDSETDIQILTKEDLWSTTTGQVSLAYNSKLVFDINKEITTKLMSKIENSRSVNTDHLSIVKKRAAELSGYISPLEDTISSFLNGKYQRNGYSVSLLAVQRSNKRPVPLLLFVPDDTGSSQPAIIYLDPKGKVNQAAPGQEIERLVRKGYIVAAVDVAGFGETKNTAVRNLTVGYSSVLTGRTVTGIAAEEINTVALFLQKQENIVRKKISALAIGQLCFPLIHAAAFNDAISSLVLVRAPLSYRSIAMNRLYKIGGVAETFENDELPELDFSWGVAGALTAYDIPDLLAAIAPRKILFIDPVNHLFNPASKELAEQELVFPLSMYKKMNVDSNIRIIYQEPADAAIGWILE